jgi:hypothetical protein
VEWIGSATDSSKVRKEEGVKFIRILVEACVQNGTVLESRKEARTILLEKKGERD